MTTEKQQERFEAWYLSLGSDGDFTRAKLVLTGYTGKAYFYTTTQAMYEQFCEIDRLRAKLAEDEGQEPVVFDLPEFHEQGMGCGLEDRCITDRYEAMRYGFEEAVDQFSQIIYSTGPLYASPMPEKVPEGWQFQGPLKALVWACKNNTGQEPSLSMYERALEQADYVLAADPKPEGEVK